MNHEHKIDHALARSNLRKILVKISIESSIGNLLGFAFIVFIYSLIDTNFAFNLYFIFFGAVLFTIGKMIVYYLNADNAIQSSELEESLKDYV